MKNRVLLGILGVFAAVVSVTVAKPVTANAYIVYETIPGTGEVISYDNGLETPEERAALDAEWARIQAGESVPAQTQEAAPAQSTPAPEASAPTQNDSAPEATTSTQNASEPKASASKQKASAPADNSNALTKTDVKKSDNTKSVDTESVTKPEPSAKVEKKAEDTVKKVTVTKPEEVKIDESIFSKIGNWFSEIIKAICGFFR